MAGGGGDTEEKCFFGKCCADPNIKKWRKKFIQPQTHMSLPLLWHEFDKCLGNFLQSKVSCCLHMYSLWRHHLPPDISENDQDNDSDDWFTYRIDIWLLTVLFVFNIWLGHALEMTINFISQPLSCFVFHLPDLLLTQNFVYPTLLSSVPASRHK
jgi:hypothetical protein